jgi:hypothetical protein
MKIFAYGVRCEQCALFCPLSYLKAKKGIAIGQLLSTEVCPLAFLCRLCATISYHAEHEVCQLAVHSPELLRKTAGSSIYRVQFQCADASCRAPLDLFTEVARQEDLGQVLDWLFPLNLLMKCSCGHVFTPLDASSFRMPTLVTEVCLNDQSRAHGISA